jgi:hypothetical protein
VGDAETSIQEEGDLDGFFTCNSSDRIRANILCLADVEKLYKVSYLQGSSFVIHMRDRDITFHLRDKFYVADMREWLDKEEATVLMSEAAENAKKYTKRQVERAMAARELYENAGFPSKEEAMRLASGMNCSDMTIDQDDMKRQFDIWGVSPTYWKGTMTKRKVGKAVQFIPRGIFEKQEIHMDIFYVAKKPFLCTVVQPLGLSVVSQLAKLDEANCGAALQAHLSLLQTGQVHVGRIFTDPQSAFKSMKDKFPGIMINIGGAGDHVDRADIRIRRLKDTTRCVACSVRWQVPLCLIGDLVTYSNIRTNMKTGPGGGIAPRCKFLGYIPKQHKEYGLKFGDYCEAWDGEGTSNDALRERSLSCIALYPSSNMQGSWVFLNMETMRRITRSYWKKLVTTQEVMDRMNKITDIKESPIPEVIPEKSLFIPLPAAAREVIKDVGEEHDVATSNEKVSDEVCDEVCAEVRDNVIVEEVSEKAPEVIQNTSTDEHTEEEVIVEDKVSEDKVSEEAAPIESRGRVGKGRNPRFEGGAPHTRGDGSAKIYHICSAPEIESPEEGMVFLVHMSVKECTKKFGKEETDKAVRKEFGQMIDKGVWSKVKSANGTRPITSSIFMKDKLDANQNLVKIKGRFVANGSQQELKAYEDRSSPTVKASSILTILKIAASEGRIIEAADIAGAYLLADIDEDVFVRIGKNVAPSLIEVDPSAKEFLQQDGTIIVRLNKALYGCVQSGLLWYRKLKEFLLELGFKPNPKDDCVFNLDKEGNQITVAFHVDDLIMTSIKQEDIDWLKKMLTEEFQEISEQSGKEISFLGMTIESDEAGLQLMMKPIVTSIIGDETGVATSPATETIFEVDDSSPLLPDSEKKTFHTKVAQTLFLARYVRPDLLTATSFLTTRVQAPTKEDQFKMQRMIRYLNGTKDDKFIISKEPISEILAFIDAAFAQHADGKSQTGMLIQIGNTPVVFKSGKQKIVTKDSTEAELVALSDKMQDVIDVKEFLEAQGFQLNPPVLFQDNQSTIQIVNSNGKDLRNKYMLVRQQLVKERWNDKDVEVKYLPTGDMIADVLTKPMQGKLFKKFKDQLMGISQARGGALEKG